MDIIFREVGPDDALEMIKFLEAVGSETDNLSFSGESLKLTPDSEKRFLNRFVSNRKNLMLVAEYNGEIVGNASVERNRTPRYSHRAELSVAVKKDFWGQGIASRLMELLIEFSKESDIEILYLEARADNERALNLYKKFGFSEIGRYEKFFKIGGKYHDASLMTLEIKNFKKI